MESTKEIINDTKISSKSSLELQCWMSVTVSTAANMYIYISSADGRDGKMDICIYMYIYTYMYMYIRDGKMDTTNNVIMMW
jgi:hypothetical protein